MSKRIWMIVLVALAALAVVHGMTSAQAKKPETEKTLKPKPVVEARARELLKEMGDYLKKAPTFTCKIKSVYDDVLADGQKLQFRADSEISLKRPNRLRVNRKGDLVSRRLYYDGKTMTMFDTIQNAYGTVKVPSTIDKALDFVMDKYSISAPGADIFYSDPYRILSEKIEGGFYVGRHMGGGVKCHHLAFTQENVDWQIWIEDGKHMVPRKIVINYKNEPGSPQFMAVLYDWDFSVKLPDRLFRFVPPRGAQKIEMREALGK